MFEFRRQRRSVRESASPIITASARHARSVDATSSSVTSPSSARSGADGSQPAAPTSVRRAEAPSAPRELPDVTGFLVVVLVTLGLFVVPVGATIMQGPAIVASILGR